MAIYTCITYQACCDGCYKEYGKFPSVEEAQQAVKSDKDWKVIDGKAYCPQCSITTPQEEFKQEDIDKIYDSIQRYLKSQQQNNGNQDQD